MTNEIPSTPAAGKGDAVHAVAKAGLSMIPLLGGPAVELFQAVVQPPLEKRRTEWMDAVGSKLVELEANGLNVASLQNNDEFITVVMQATQAAMRSHNLAKREALANAILNVAVGQAPDETEQHLLLGFIDTLTEMHLRILKVFQNPSPPAGISMGGLSLVLEQSIPSLRGRRDMYEQLWKDLYIRGLINTEGFNATMSASGLGERRTTALGDALIRFTSEPVLS